MDYAERRTTGFRDWFRIDGMEKGLPEEKETAHDQEKGRFTVIDRFRQGVSSLTAGLLGRAPQNVCLLFLLN